MGGQSANNAAVLGVASDYPANGLFPAGETVYIVGKIISHSSANDQVYLNAYRLTDTVPSQNQQHGWHPPMAEVCNINTLPG
jgi:hypothetical protein